MGKEELIDYFIEQTNGRLDEIKEDLTQLRGEIKELNEFKLRMMGIWAGVMLVITLASEAIRFIMETKGN